LLRGCKNRPGPFPGWMSYKATKPGLALSIVYLSMLYTVLLFIRPLVYVLLVFVGRCSVLVVLVKSSLLAKRLARKTPPRKSNCGEGIISINTTPKSVLLSWFITGRLPWQPDGIKFTQCVSDQKSAFLPCRKNYALDRKMTGTF